MAVTASRNPSLPSEPTSAPAARYIPPALRKRLDAASEPRTDETPNATQRKDMFADGSGNDARADRWKKLDAGTSRSFFDSSRQQRPKESVTGTRWDVRDKREYKPEDEATIFDEEAERSTGIKFECYDSIPVELAGKDSEDIKPLHSFKEAEKVHPLLRKNISRVDYEKPTPVQKYSIPVILAGKDLMACAQTGSGKTAAFLFPIITKMLNDGPPKDIQSKNFRFINRSCYPVALVLSPTRELAVQIYKESRKFSFGTGIQTHAIYGGSSYHQQSIALRQGLDICVATPGRLTELLARSIVCFKCIRYLVLDEADRMLDMGFSPQIQSIVESYEMPTSAQGRQTVMFSATFPQPIQKLAENYLKDFLYLTVGRVGSTNESIIQQLIYAKEEDKPNRLIQVLKKSQGGLLLIFVETKRKADLIGSFLGHSGFKAVCLHGDKSQEERESALQLFRTGHCPILVATDVAARGLDIHNIEHVINCDLPSRIEDYVHRIGRTGRAGNSGIATSFVNESNRPLLRNLLTLLEESRQDIPNWFYELVRSCTSAYKQFNNHRHNSAFSSNQNMHGNSGGRDKRGGGFDSSSGFDRFRQTRVEDEEDGW